VRTALADRGADTRLTGGGMPNPECFPLSGLSLTLRDGKRIDLVRATLVRSGLVVPDGAGAQSKAELEEALQYSPTVCAHGQLASRS
jgi:hypothetical protein